MRPDLGITRWCQPDGFKRGFSIAHDHEQRFTLFRGRTGVSDLQLHDCILPSAFVDEKVFWYLLALYNEKQFHTREAHENWLFKEGLRRIRDGVSK